MSSYEEQRGREMYEAWKQKGGAKPDWLVVALAKGRPTEQMSDWQPHFLVAFLKDHPELAQPAPQPEAADLVLPDE